MVEQKYLVVVVKHFKRQQIQKILLKLGENAKKLINSFIVSNKYKIG
jgi:hypothetical protein